MSWPTYSAIKGAFSPGDVILVLVEDYSFQPVEIQSITRKSFLTEVGEILFVDHDWLWRALKPKE